jgi:spore germination protein YaaH
MPKLTKWFICFSILLAYPTFSNSQNKIERIFYYVDHQSSFNSLLANIDQITIVAPQIYKIDAEGNITGTVDSRLLEITKQHNVGVLPLIVNPGFDQEIIHAVLKDSLARRRAIMTMLALCQENKFIGLQFDFEHIGIDYKDIFTQFFKDAAEVLHRNGFIISAAVFPRTGDSAEPGPYQKWHFENKSGAYDYKALAEAADFLSIMTYDQHSRLTPPGPVAGLPWIEAVLKYLFTQIPVNKISLGIPLYSYHWYPTADEQGGHPAGRGMGFNQAVSILKDNNASELWNEKQKVSFTYFEKDGVFEYIFLENARSFRAKLELVRKYNLRGFSAWRLGLEDSGIWEILKK